MARELAARGSGHMIEDEVGRILGEASLNARQREVLARRLGWDGEGGTTLEAAAGGELTRERVRQLEERVRDASAKTRWLPTVESALALLAERAPITADAAAELLAAEGLSRRPFDPVGLLNVARFARIETPLSFAAGNLYVGDQREAAARISDAARKLISHNGAASVSAIVDSLDGSGLDADAVRRSLALDPETRWLDQDREWLFLPTGKNRAANHLRKMLAVAPSLSVSDVREGMRRYRDREVNLPRDVLRELCKCFDWVRVDGDRIGAVVPLDFRAVLENTEETLVDIFREHGPVLDRATAVELGERHGLDRTTTGLYLGWSPLIERIATNRYALRGSDVPAGTLEAMRGSSPRKRVQRGYGWTSSGRLWVGYTLSQAVIDSHVIGVPSALKDELRGHYDLAPPNGDLGQLATDGTNLWGLSRLLKRYAAEAGDALVLEFDLVARKVHSFIGGQELLDPENRPEQVVEERTVGSALVGSDEPVDGREEARASADDGAEEAAASNGDREAGMEELLPLRPALLEPQLLVGLGGAAFEPETEVQATDAVRDEETPSATVPESAESAVPARQPDTTPPPTLLEALKPRQRRLAGASDEAFGPALEQLMRSSGTTFRKLAQATELSAGYLNHLVHGHRPVPAADVIEKIASALGVEPTCFLEYRLERVHEALGERPWVVDQLFVDLALADPDTSGAVLSDDSFGAAMELVMNGLEMSYRQLAERTGLSAGFLNHIVHGSRAVPERPVLVDIAKALDVEPDFFFDYRLMKVVDVLLERPDVVNDLFARFGERTMAMAEPSTTSAESPAAAAEDPDDAHLPGDDVAARRDDVVQRCVVPGCNEAGKHKLGVRCRVWHEPSPIPGKSKTSALWAPDSDAFLCDQHALGGAHITLIFEPNDSGETAVKVIAAPHGDDRRTPIRHEPRGGETQKEVKSIELTFDEERETKGTVRFQERVDGDAEPKVGTLYVRKSTLAELDWQSGTPLKVTLSA